MPTRGCCSCSSAPRSRSGRAPGAILQRRQPSRNRNPAVPDTARRRPSSRPESAPARSIDRAWAESRAGREYRNRGRFVKACPRRSSKSANCESSGERRPTKSARTPARRRAASFVPAIVPGHSGRRWKMATRHPPGTRTTAESGRAMSSRSIRRVTDDDKAGPKNPFPAWPRPPRKNAAPRPS